MNGTYDVVIAGAGPAGSSAAIHLASHNVRVLLVEQKKFPRPKLCGEFISPECLKHFHQLGVEARMISSNPAVLTETVFYSRSGRGLRVPSNRLGGGALGLSRAVMDNNLLRRAAEAGVTILENSSVTEVMEENGQVRGVRLRSDGVEREYDAVVTIDATGRKSALSRKLKSLPQNAPRSRPKLIAFKAHLEGTKVAQSACEIYSYPGGYGGLSTIEGGLSNLCFITAAKDVRRSQSDPETVLREVVLKNRRAECALKSARVCSEWLSVSLERFDRHCPSPVKGLLAIGDSAAFIDPFTGSGMLMALESGELSSRLVVRHIQSLRRNHGFTALSNDYALEYRRKFDSRLRISSGLRRLAFTPLLAEMGIVLFGASKWLRNYVVRSTRPDHTIEPSPLEPVKWE